MIPCPACGKMLPPKGIPKHVNGCPKWATVIGVPPSQFNFDQHFKRGLYADGLTEGQDFVACLACGFRAKRLMDHIKNVHGLTEGAYQESYPEALVRLPSTLEARKKTVQARYGVDNVFQADPVMAQARETSLTRYGVEHAAVAPEVQARRAATNRERYGHDNPFAASDVQSKIRETHLARRGVAYPNQDPAVVEKRVATNRERYGADHLFNVPGFRESFRLVCLTRFGADHPMKSERGRAIWRTGVRRKLGVDNPLSRPDIWQKSYQTNLANHGGQHSQTCPDVRAKAQATWLEKYGVDNPSKAEVVKARIKEVWLGKYGVPFPPQSLWFNRAQSFPNGLEKQVIQMAFRCLVYAGDGSYWVQAPGESRARNPDFVVLSGEQVGAFRDGADLNGLRTFAVVETFGDYWHGPAKTGKERTVHAAEVRGYYRRAGIDCLIIWESEVKKHPKRTAERIALFLIACGRDG